MPAQMDDARGNRSPSTSSGVPRSAAGTCTQRRSLGHSPAAGPLTQSRRTPARTTISSPTGMPSSRQRSQAAGIASRAPDGVAGAIEHVRPLTSHRRPENSAATRTCPHPGHSGAPPGVRVRCDYPNPPPPPVGGPPVGGPPVGGPPKFVAGPRRLRLRLPQPRQTGASVSCGGR